jgi:glycosyltransferase involved in cell wall biosynthesis
LQHRIKTLANSQHTRNVIISKMGITEDIEIIPNYINTNYFKFTEKKLTGTKFIITYAGRFDKGKNIDLIIETAKCLIQNDKNVQFLLYGDGPEKTKAEELIKKYNLTEDVLIPGFTNDMDSVYKKCHLFLFLSSYESFGNVVAEALLSGTPALCHKIPAISELINDELFFVNTLAPEVIADKILFLKNNYNLLAGRLKIVHKKLIKYLDNCSISDKLQSLYNNFLRQ